SAKITASIPVENPPNDQIIIYGGTRTTDEVDFNQVYPDVLVLDTKKDPYEITAPDISTNTGIFPSLAGHTANLFGYYMIVAFGNTTHKDDEPSLGKNGIIYVMDIRNFTWINSLDQAADNKTLKTSSPVSQSNKNKLKLLLATAFGISGGLLALTGGFFVYRWINIRKREKDHAPGFFGSNDDDSIPGTPTDDNLSSY
ncbi:3560_t:CDS:2, partial [Rhizophagus irregularis]